MAWNADARTPLTLAVDRAALAVLLAAGPPAALLAEAWAGPLPAGVVALASLGAATPAHPFGCACCAGRSAAAAALDRLFQARVRGQCPWFERVVALAETPALAAEIAAALTEDRLTAARFRLTP